MKAYRPWLVLSLVALFVVLGGWLASYFLRGYRFDWRHGIFAANGLLVVNSDPKGAAVFINGKLTTASDDTLSLPPGNYRVRLRKDGYLPWQKTIKVKKEVVKQTDADLFRAVPDLKPLTFAGAINPQLSPGGGQLVYAVASAAASSKNGLWVNDLSTSPLDIVRSHSRQLVRRDEKHHWEKAHLVWSPDSRQVLAYFTDKKGEISHAYLLPANHFSASDQLGDISLQLAALLQHWQKQKRQQMMARLENYPPVFSHYASVSARLLTFSPDGNRLAYLASKPITLPAHLRPWPPARSDQPEERHLRPGWVYVYNLKEDTNFALGPAASLGVVPSRLSAAKTLAEQFAQLNYQPFRWLATNRHLLYHHQGRIMVVEADGQNRQTVFAGPFVDGFVYPWPDGKRLIVLTALASGRPANLYVLGIH